MSADQVKKKKKGEKVAESDRHTARSAEKEKKELDKHNRHIVCVGRPSKKEKKEKRGKICGDGCRHVHVIRPGQVAEKRKPMSAKN